MALSSAYWLPSKEGTPRKPLDQISICPSVAVVDHPVTLFSLNNRYDEFGITDCQCFGARDSGIGGPGGDGDGDNRVFDAGA